MSTTTSTPPKPPPTSSTLKPNRLPAPTLFVGPPSHNASSTSLLPPPKDSSGRAPLSRQHSLLGEGARKAKDREAPYSPPPDRSTLPVPGTGTGTAASAAAAEAASLSPLGRERSRVTPALGTQTGADRVGESGARKDTQALKDAADSKRVDAAWAEMQSTLSEVEASAQQGGSINAVFGPGHASALEELRRAQVGLAKAWARSEVDDLEGQAAQEAANKKSEGAEEGVDAGEGKRRDLGVNMDVLNAERQQKLGTSTVGATKDQQGRGRSDTGDTGDSGKSALEEETENDIRLARKRREANDRYFSRVNKGVLDVVSRLEEVAKAMKVVEMESREIWGGEEGLDEG